MVFHTNLCNLILLDSYFVDIIVGLGYNTIAKNQTMQDL
jgi:hypothetical protein